MTRTEWIVRCICKGVNRAEMRCADEGHARRMLAYFRSSRCGGGILMRRDSVAVETIVVADIVQADGEAA